MATIKFWSEMTKATSVDGQDKVMIGKDSNGEAMYVDFQYLVNQAGAQTSDYIPIDGNTLPTLGTESKFSIVGSGTYNQAVGGDVVVPESSLGIIVWDGDEWSLSQSVELPSNASVINNWSSGSYPKDTVKIGADGYIYRAISETNAEPMETAASWEVIGNNVKKVNNADLNTLFNSGLYRVYTGANNSYFLEIVSAGGVIRQYRTNSGSGTDDTYLSYRDYDTNASSPSWTSWTDSRGIKRVSVADVDNTKKVGLYWVYSSTGGYLMQVQVASGGVVRQMRTNPAGSSTGEDIPYFMYRDFIEGAWTSWISVSFMDIDSSTDYNITKPGVYLKRSTNPRPMLVWSNSSDDGQIIKIMRLYPGGDNNTKSVMLQTRVSEDGGSTWTGWINLFDFNALLDGSSTNINSLTNGGVYKLNQTSGDNSYLVFVATASNVTRQYRIASNIGLYHRGLGPSLQYRDRPTSTGVWSEWIDVTNQDNRKTLSTNEDIMWSWWNYPQLRMENNPINRFLLPYTDSMGNVGLYEKNLSSASELKTEIKEYIIDIDDHNAGGVIQLSDGKYLTAFSGSHNRTGVFYIYKGAYKYNTTEWEQKYSSNVGSPATYSQILYINNVTYVFFRTYTANTGLWTWSMISSADEGETWSAVQEVIRQTTLQWYCLFRPVEDNDNLIRIVHYSNPSSQADDIRGGFIKIDTMQVLDINASTVIGVVGGENTGSSFSVIVPLASGYRQRLLDTKISETHNWQIGICRFQDETNGTYLHYNNGDLITVCQSGKAFYAPSYFGGFSFGNDFIVSSRFDSNDDKWKIEKYVLNGSEYNIDDVIHEDEKVNIRPLVDGNMCAWVSGHYSSSAYTDFYTEVKYKVFEQN